MQGGQSAAPLPPPVATASRLAVRLSKTIPVATQPPAAPRATGKAALAPAVQQRRSAQHRLPGAGSNPSTTQLPTTTQPPPAADAQAMIAQGKALLNQESRRQIFDPMFAPPTAQAAPSVPPLARLGALPEAGERQITERIYQYTAANGQRFCVTAPPPGINSLADSSALTVATNCPH